MAPGKQSSQTENPPAEQYVRDSLAEPQALLAARSRPMSERLELALSWNAVAAELRSGLAVALKQAKSEH